MMFPAKEFNFQEIKKYICTDISFEKKWMILSMEFYVTSVKETFNYIFVLHTRMFIILIIL